MKYIVGIYVTILVTIFPLEALALININTATSEELQTLNGIGPTYASRIIDARPFSIIEDIKNVNGIGEATYEKIKNDITVNGSTQIILEESAAGADSAPDTVATKSSTKDKKEFKPVNGLVMDIPNIGYVNQLIEFDVEPTDGTNNRLVRYSWNFGDGKIADTKNPVHRYKFPGTYLVVVESYYLKNTKTVRKQLTILEVNISLNKTVEGDFSLTNNGLEEIDIGGMSLGQSFVFPKHTIILPDRSITISKEEVPHQIGDVALYDQSGTVVSITKQTENSFKLPSSNMVVSQTLIRDSNTKKDEVINTASTTIEQVNNLMEVDKTTTAGDNKKFPPATLPYVGLFGIISLGIFMIYSKNI